MYYQKYESPTEQFLSNGWYYTNDSEVIAQIIIDLKDRNIAVAAKDSGDYKYAIKIA